MDEQEIISRLFGKIEPMGETNADEERYNNLSSYDVIVAFLISELTECIKYKDDNRYSVKRIGEKAYAILQEQYECLKDYIEEE